MYVRLCFIQTIVVIARVHYYVFLQWIDPVLLLQVEIHGHTILLYKMEERFAETVM
jgi:hypothetical protein